MRHNKVVLTHNESEVFDRAVRERAIAVVTLQQDSKWATFKCRFLERDPSMQFFVLDYNDPNGDDSLPPLSLGQYVGVSFRHGSRKVMFSTVVEAKGKYILPDNTEIAAIRYRWPQALTELQRRVFHRALIPTSQTLLGHLWDGGMIRRASAQNGTLEIVNGELVDISCGGAMIRLHGNRQPNWGETATLGAELQLGDGRPPVRLDANFRGFRTDEQGRVCAAVQFVGLELTVDGREVLHRLASVVQRLNREGLRGADQGHEKPA
jgi:c-di-GMP-binding flagellar brake protein YcgR